VLVCGTVKDQRQQKDRSRHAAYVERNTQVELSSDVLAKRLETTYGRGPERQEADQLAEPGRMQVLTPQPSRKGAHQRQQPYEPTRPRLSR